MRLQCRQYLAHECSICLRLMDDERSRADSIRAALFGHRKFAMCPGCLREVPCEAWTLDYRRRWGVAVRAINREAKAEGEGNSDK